MPVHPHSDPHHTRTLRRSTDLARTAVRALGDHATPRNPARHLSSLDYPATAAPAGTSPPPPPRHAGVVFTARQTLADAQAFDRDLKRRATAGRVRPGRAEDHEGNIAGETLEFEAEPDRLIKPEYGKTPPANRRGTPERGHREGVADGFHVMPAVVPCGLESFVDHMVPIPQRRGLPRTEYTVLGASA